MHELTRPAHLLAAMHTGTAELGLECTEGFAAMSTRRSVEGDEMVVKGVDIGLTMSGYSLILRQNRAKLTLSQVTLGAEGEALIIRVINGQPTEVDDVYVHFAIPPAR